MNSTTIVATDSLAVAQATAEVRARVRLPAIDLARGMVIVLMALDHVRDYFTNAHFDVLDPAQTSVGLYFTRWITHLCAPTFMLLAGISAYLVSTRCTRAQLSRFLVTRGVWLILLEFTVVLAAWSFNLRYSHGLVLQVIWALGASMVVLALLVHLPLRAIGAIGLVMVCAHNLLDPIAPAQFGAWAPLWNLLHVGGRTSFGIVAYPLIPWVGVMALGFVLGSLYQLPPSQRRPMLWVLGATALVLFVLLRAANGYGDPHPWQPQATALMTLMSFLDVEKYPPSLLYLLVTLGTALLLLAAFERVRGRVAEVLATFGRVPLFVYVAHIALAHLLAGLLALALGYGTDVLTNDFMSLPRDWGFDLPVVYVAWLCVLAMLYPACRWFAALKRRRTDWWLSYL
jgi:uncharacterized membrane protein